MISFALDRDERGLVERLLDSTAASGALWFAAGDSLVSCLLAAPVTRSQIDEGAFALLDALKHRHGLAHVPDFPDVDLDESVQFAESAEAPAWTAVRPCLVGGICVGGLLLFSSGAPGSGAEKALDEAADVLAAALQIRRLERRLDTASDRFLEIAEIGRIFADVGEPLRTISRILELAVRFSGAETGAIVQASSGGAMTATGMKMETIAAIRLRDGFSVLDRVLSAEGNEPLILFGADLAARLDLASSALVIESLAAYPLVHEAKRYGVLVLLNIAPELMPDPSFLATLETVARLAAAALTTEERQAERLEQERTKKDLSAARTIQQSLLPRNLPAMEGMRLEGLWHPSLSVGGDYYDIFRLDDRRVAVVIADVSGKGIPASLLMALSRAYLRVIAPQHPESPAAALARLNDLLCGEIASNKFITANYIVLDVTARQGRLANAGHHEPVMIGSDGTPRTLETPASGGGLPLGIQRSCRYDDVDFSMEEGAAVVLYTDGLVEARDDASGMIGLEGLLSMLRGTQHLAPRDLLEMLWRKTLEFSGVPDDDWTAVALSFGSPAPNPPVS